MYYDNPSGFLQSGVGQMAPAGAGAGLIGGYNPMGGVVGGMVGADQANIGLQAAGQMLQQQGTETERLKQILAQTQAETPLKQAQARLGIAQADSQVPYYLSDLPKEILKSHAITELSANNTKVLADKMTNAIRAGNMAEGLGGTLDQAGGFLQLAPSDQQMIRDKWKEATGEDLPDSPGAAQTRINLERQMFARSKDMLMQQQKLLTEQAIAKTQAEAHIKGAEISGGAHVQGAEISAEAIKTPGAAIGHAMDKYHQGGMDALNPAEADSILSQRQADAQKAMNQNVYQKLQSLESDPVKHQQAVEDYYRSVIPNYDAWKAKASGTVVSPQGQGSAGPVTKADVEAAGQQYDPKYEYRKLPDGTLQRRLK